MTVIAGLQLTQALFLLLLGALLLRPVLQVQTQQWFQPALVPRGLLGVAYTGLGLTAIWVALGFWRLWRPSWLGSTFLQAMLLLLALVQYWRDKPFYVYPVMTYGILMVLYLHHVDVLGAFRSVAPSAGQAE